MTQNLLDRLGVRSPWRCLDVGAGIGCVTLPLARRLKPKGEVVALEQSAVYADLLHDRAKKADLKNIFLINDRLENFKWRGPGFDLILCRWVFLFIKDIESRLKRLVPMLSPGGYLAIEDYHDYRGMTFYPESPAFERVIPAAQKWFAKNGGGLDVAGRLPAIMAKLGLRVVDFRPNVQAGGGRSEVFRWAELFFSHYIDSIAQAGNMTPREVRDFKKTWLLRKKDPVSRFVSPIIFDVVGQKPRR